MADSDPVTKKDLTDGLTEFKESLTEFKESLTELKDSLTELMRNIETNLLTSFHGYGRGQALRMHNLEISDSAVKGRLEALEERVLNLETRPRL